MAILLSGEAKNVAAILILSFIGCLLGLYGIYQFGYRKQLILIPKRGQIEELSGYLKYEDRSYYSLQDYENVRLKRTQVIGPSTGGGSTRRRQKFYVYEVLLCGPEKTLALGTYSKILGMMVPALSG